MNIYILLGSALFVFLCGYVSMRLYRPLPPFVFVKSKPTNILLSTMGSWIFITLSSVVEHQIIKYPHVSMDVVFFLTRLISWGFTAVILHARPTRVVHPGLFTIPTYLNILAGVSQIQAVNMVTFSNFAIAKVMRIACIAILMKESPYYIVLSLLFSSFYYDKHLPTVEGVLYLLVFVLSDALTSVSQETIFKKFKVDGITMMYYINLYSVIILVPALCNQLYFEIDTFLMILVTILAIFVSCSQYFALSIIKHHGAVVYSVTCSLRSIFIMLPSSGQWIELLVILAFLITSIANGLAQRRRRLLQEAAQRTIIED